jgi:hypothetical protein
MEQLLAVLSQLGLGLATNAVYDLLKGVVGHSVDKSILIQEVQNRINLHGVTMTAETVINALAQNGVLVIVQSKLHANEALTFGSQIGSAVIGNNSVLTTNRSAITAGAGAFMETKGNAQVRQNSDGSISFHVGDGGNINWKIAK